MTDTKTKPLISRRDVLIFAWLLGILAVLKVLSWLPDPLGGYLFVLLFITGTTVGIIAFFGRYDQREMAAWGAFADACGLTLEQRRHLYFRRLGEVAGDYRGRAVTLDHLHTGGRYGPTCTRLRVALRMPFAGRLELQREGVGAKLKRLAGNDDIQLHDVAFDPRWEVKCSDPALPSALLGPETRDALRDLKRWWFEWQGDHATAMRRDMEMQSDALTTALTALSDVADRLARVGPHRDHAATPDGDANAAAASTATPTLTVNCPSCGGATTVPDGARPLDLTCPHCHRWMVVK